MKLEKYKFIEGLQLISFLLGLVAVMVIPGKLLSGQEINFEAWVCNIIAIVSLSLAVILKRELKLIFITVFQVLLFACPIYAVLLFVEMANSDWTHLFGRTGVILVGLILLSIFSAVMYCRLQNKSTLVQQ